MGETLNEMKYRHENELIELDREHEGERSLLERSQIRQIEEKKMSINKLKSERIRVVKDL